MSLTGHLQDTSLASLTQMLCLDQQSGVLVLENSHQGCVYFQKGHLVHAEAPEATGQQALYHLLAWRQGRFTFYRDRHPPKQTINNHWQELLLEGMRRLDESRRQEQQNPQHQVKADKEQQQIYNSLIQLLSELEQQLVSLEDPKIRKNPSSTFPVLCHCINRTMDFMDKHFPQCRVSLKEALDQLGGEWPEARQRLEVYHNRLDRHSLEQCQQRWLWGKRQKQQCQQIYQLLVRLLRYHLDTLFSHNAKTPLLANLQETTEMLLSQFETYRLQLDV